MHAAVKVARLQELRDARLRAGTAGDANRKSSVDQTVLFNNAWSSLRRTRPLN